MAALSGFISPPFFIDIVKAEISMEIWGVSLVPVILAEGKYPPPPPRKQDRAQCNPGTLVYGWIRGTHPREP